MPKKWSKKYKRSIDCNNPKGFSQKAHCAGRKKKESKMSSKLEELVGKSITEEQFDEAAGKKDKCYYKVKARYDVWPSAYASGALVKCRKVGAANWGKSKKEGLDDLKALPKDLKKSIKKNREESVNEAPMELNKIKDAIKMFQKKIEKQGRVTNARDEEHLKNLIKLYIQMGGKGIKEGYSMRDLGLSPFWKKLNPDQRQAVSIALIMGGNMSGAIKAIEKIKKGLSKDKKVKNALKMANEGFASAAQRRAAFASGYKAKGKKKKKEGVKEGKFTKIMKAVRKGPKAGPWTFIISKNNKIKKQVSVKNIKEIPAYYEDLKKAYPNDKIGIEAKDGKIVYRESVNEGTCGYGIDGKIGEEPAGPNLMKKIKAISKDKEKKKLLKSKKVNERLNQSQAKTLLRQLGGNKFIMMTGAKQMSIGKNGLTMKIGRNSKSITHVAIDLDRGKDLYIMKFIRVRKGIPKVVKQYDGIYADNLNNIFEKETGLYTRL